MSSLPCFNSSLEKIFKNLKSINFFGTTEPLVVDILKKCQKIEEFYLFTDDSHCKSFLKHFFQYILRLDFSKTFERC